MDGNNALSPVLREQTNVTQKQNHRVLSVVTLVPVLSGKSQNGHSVQQLVAKELKSV